MKVGILRLRVFIVDMNNAMRDSLAIHVESLGHVVVVASSMSTCPHYHSEGQRCSQDTSCGDAMILGQELTSIKGIDFIERRIIGGCKGVAANNALICRPWSYGEEKRLEALGCRFFETPLQLKDISNWLKEVGECFRSAHESC